MISRVADHCFWFGRYLERAESTARVLYVTRNLAIDADLEPAQCWLPVLIVSGEKPVFLEKFGAHAAGDGDAVQRYLTHGDNCIASIERSIGAARENARSVREVVSLESWESINELHLWLASTHSKDDFEQQRDAFYQHVRKGVQLCLGLLRSTMLHDEPLDFIWLGVMLERVGQTARILDVEHHAFSGALGQRADAMSSNNSGNLVNQGAHASVLETSLWLSLLRACSGFEPYMKRHQGRVSSRSVAEFLIFEPQFPRSIRYCLTTALRYLEQIRPPERRELPGGQSVTRLRTLDTWLNQQASQLLDDGDVHELLTHVVDETAKICNDIGHELLS